MKTPNVQFPHRVNLNGTHESICRVCLTTVATVEREDDLAVFDSQHVCDPMRVYQMNRRTYIASPSLCNAAPSSDHARQR
jgi:hypothetical protein